ncbi:MAG: hypothetical protein KIT34_03575 [Cyanobacteria bacterium TGS_CYA1]|nr:hypothetical protein [Cyanobacteria bacterium TGS_CYA1]
MTAQQVLALKQSLEERFPGLWLNGENLGGTEISGFGQTGIEKIDACLSPRALNRQRITHWVGPGSSGKTTLLRKAVAKWCEANFNIVYIDTQGQLMANDWAYINENHCKHNRLWFVRPDAGEVKTLNHYVGVVDLFLASRAFDIVIMDLGTNQKLSLLSYSRLQRALQNSKSALLVVGSQADNQGNIQLGFQWDIQSVQLHEPQIACSITKNGLSTQTEVAVSLDESNCLFTHPQICDRRSREA